MRTAANMSELSERLLNEIVEAVKELVRKEQSDRLRDIYLVGDIEKDTARQAIERLRELASESHKPITIYINSAGGNVTDGLALHDTIRYLVSLGHEITIVVQGMAYSMGSVVLQAASPGKRLAFPHSWIMIHEPAKWAGWQSTSAAAQHLDRLKQMQSQIYRILADRSGKPLRQIIRDTKRTDFYLDAAAGARLRPDRRGPRARRTRTPSISPIHRRRRKATLPTRQTHHRSPHLSSPAPTCPRPDPGVAWPLRLIQHARACAHAMLSRYESTSRRLSLSHLFCPSAFCDRAGSRIGGVRDGHGKRCRARRGEQVPGPGDGRSRERVVRRYWSGVGGDGLRRGPRVGRHWKPTGHRHSSRNASGLVRRPGAAADGGGRGTSRRPAIRRTTNACRARRAA